jgi:hypothetical protein
MLADHAWVDEEGEMDYSFVPFSDDQQTLSITASVVGSSVGLSDGHTGTVPSDVEDPVIKALRQRQQEEVERRHHQDGAEKRRRESPEKTKQREKLAEVKEVRSFPSTKTVTPAAEDFRSKQQARLEEYKRIEEEKKERRRLYEEKNQNSVSPMKPVPAAAVATSWRQAAQPVSVPPAPTFNLESAPVRIALRPVGDLPGLVGLDEGSNAAALRIASPDKAASKERTLSVRLEAKAAPVKLRFVPFSAAELKAAIALPAPHYRLDLARSISMSALQ